MRSPSPRKPMKLIWRRLVKIGNQLWQRMSRHHRHALILGFSLILLVGIGRSLPYLFPIRAADIVQDRQAIAFSDRHGLPLGTLLTRDREHTATVDLNQVSPHFINAILAAEDGRFYHHGAIDWQAAGRSLLDSIKAKKIVSGASTITMQLARMLSPIPRTVTGKMQEIWMAWRLAAGMNKNEILAAYINRLPMGGNIYGVEAASQIYFGIPAADLNLAQASLLAALPNDPARLNPYNYSPRLTARQNYVLNQMVQDGYITRPQAEVVEKEPIVLQTRQQGIIAAPHFLFWLASQLPPQHSSQIRTTIDRSLQQFVETQVQQVVRNLADHNVHQGAAIAIDNHTGEILAYVGSPDYFDQTQLGRNDGVQALRQPGSTLKPFLYQLGLEQRLLRPNSILADVPTRYAIPGAKLYSPADYNQTFLGPVRVRLALANSLNIPAVRVLEKVGVEVFLDRLRQLGFEYLTQSPEYYGLGLTLGSGEVSLWELAKAYLVLARQGEILPLQTTLPATNSPIPPAIGTKSTWGLIANILSDRHARAKAFGVDSLLDLPFPSAVKTGTSSDFRDTWTVGFTNDYTVATWVGNFNGERMRQVSGVMGAAPLWNRIILHLHEQQEPSPLPPPPGLVSRPICALSGMRPTAACPEVVQEYFDPVDLPEYERQFDTFYQVSGKGKILNLPDEYNEWLALQPANMTVSKLKILSPRNGDIFLWHSPHPDAKSSDPTIQRLEFKLAAPAQQTVEWLLNGKKLPAPPSNSFFWDLSPGEWTLEVTSGKERDRVSFQVQVAQYRPTRQGFSIANP